MAVNKLILDIGLTSSQSFLVIYSYISSGILHPNYFVDVLK